MTFVKLTKKKLSHKDGRPIFCSLLTCRVFENVAKPGRKSLCSGVKGKLIFPFTLKSHTELWEMLLALRVVVNPYRRCDTWTESADRWSLLQERCVRNAFKTRAGVRSAAGAGRALPRWQALVLFHWSRTNGPGSSESNVIRVGLYGWQECKWAKSMAWTGAMFAEMVS